jgi:hypothetical protein
MRAGLAGGGARKKQPDTYGPLTCPYRSTSGAVGIIPIGLEADPSCDLGWRGTGWRGAIGSKAFFSEEKKQKTFANSGTCAARKVRDSN